MKFRRALDCRSPEEDAEKEEPPKPGSASDNGGSSGGSPGCAEAAAAAADVALSARAAALAAAAPEAAANTAQSWGAQFDAAAAAAGTGELTRAQFVAVANAVLTAASDKGSGPAAVPPTEGDLDRAFGLADADGSGLVDRREFITLMGLAQRGEVAGLSAAAFGWSPLTWGKEAAFRKALAVVPEDL